MPDTSNYAEKFYANSIDRNIFRVITNNITIIIIFNNYNSNTKFFIINIIILILIIFDTNIAQIH